jgi:hypothetical protein
MSSFEARCPQCLFVSRQLGQPTPCLLHVSLTSDDVAVRMDAEDLPTSASDTADYDEPYTFGELHPTVDRPGPFTIREYVRLQLLKSRINASPSPLDQRTQAKTLSRR